MPSTPTGTATGTPTGTATRPTLADVVDLDRYPIDRLDDAAGVALVERGRRALATTGAHQLPGFLRPDAVARLVAESVAARGLAHRTDDEHTVYLQEPPVDAGPDDPAAQRQHSSKSAIAWDLVAPDSPLRIAYTSTELTAFLGRVLGVEPLHRYADPLGAASLMIFDEGDELGWHFDRSPFAVTVMLQTSERGGAYEYHYHLRDADDDNPAGVAAALRDELPGRITLPNEPGTLSLFRGRHSMHRVTPVQGDRPRINAVLAYSERPDDVLNAHTRELFYGRRA